MTTEIAQKLCRNQTDAECRLWQHLRNRHLAGHKFRRQYPLTPYIVDFICLERKLIIELDGSPRGAAGGGCPTYCLLAGAGIPSDPILER